jgi:hypothetical protein
LGIKAEIFFSAAFFFLFLVITTVFRIPIIDNNKLIIKLYDSLEKGTGFQLQVSSCPHET